MSLLIGFFLCWVQRRTERTKKRRMKKNKTMKHRPDKFSFFNLFRSFSASNTSLDGIVDPK
jgi:hypothetical protein